MVDVAVVITGKDARKDRHPEVAQNLGLYKRPLESTGGPHEAQILSDVRASRSVQENEKW